MESLQHYISNDIPGAYPAGVTVLFSALSHRLTFTQLQLLAGRRCLIAFQGKTEPSIFSVRAVRCGRLLVTDLISGIPRETARHEVLAIAPERGVLIPVELMNACDKAEGVEAHTDLERIWRLKRAGKLPC